jgi:SAM-dependent methyltransferase
LLRCPACKGSLEIADAALLCEKCLAEYPIVQGVPILINDVSSVFRCSDYCPDGNAYRGDSYGKSSDATTSSLKKAYHRFASHLLNFAISRSHLDAENALKRVQERIPTPRILVIGSGDEKYVGPGEFVYTDVAFSKTAGIICDAHDLPFPDEAFDLVLAVAVLEHVVDPAKCVAEIWRVLKPDRWVYAATPFLQPVHMGAYDFTRFTYLGHRRLFRYFEDEASGMALGPGAGLAWSFRCFLTSLTDNRPLQSALSLMALILSIPLKYADYMTRKHTSSLDAAAGVFFFGPKAVQPIPDREIIRLYRGGYTH